MAEALPATSIEIDCASESRILVVAGRFGRRFTTNITWRAAHGFGVYTLKTVFGEGRDEVYKPP